MGRDMPPFISRYEKHLAKQQNKYQAKSEKYAQKAVFYGEKLANERKRLDNQ